MNPELDAIKLEDGSLPVYAWPGGYPIFYVTDDGAEMCHKCANGSDCKDAEPGDGWFLDGHGCNWEDPDLYCDGCSDRIESAYAEDEVKAK